MKQDTSKMVPLITYWYRALSSPLGVEVVCSDTESVRQKLYAVRAEIKDEALKRVSLCISPYDPNKIWLLRKDPENEAS
jgi:hypothetical protein